MMFTKKKKNDGKIVNSDEACEKWERKRTYEGQLKRKLSFIYKLSPKGKV